MDKTTHTHLTKLQNQLPKETLAAVLISSSENRRYISGFTGSAGYLFITAELALLYTDSRYTQQATKETSGFEIRQVEHSGWFGDLLEDLPSNSRIGYENRAMTVALFDQLNTFITVTNKRSRKSLSFSGLDGLLERLRSIKTPEEVVLIEQAAQIADKSYMDVTTDFEGGISERELAWRIEMAIHHYGGDGPSFPTIVASGPNAALPHHQPSDKLIGHNEPIVIDMGVRFQGYCSDMTRTLYIGSQDIHFRNIYDTVLAAQQTAIATVSTGMSGSQADSLARTVIDDASYGSYFGHSLGHGIGILVHEYPTLSPKSDNILENNMIFTIEPGIYIEDWGGVRIEDMVLLEETNVLILTKAPKL
jgi:Xaa-Pro aminopeptidase